MTWSESSPGSVPLKRAEVVFSVLSDAKAAIFPPRNTEMLSSGIQRTVVRSLSSVVRVPPFPSI